ncbi:glycosyltransferase family 4 protein [Gymnodinialimonas ceratoperidinii]|uniref:Glycosyltransferase family 4 protein n=1 Tax=Gymnodinialimonas ceratoperidinii TaxID=2856823 RepID=A0A8F6TWI4_9RHOB|nr:glycosyltransferase family 4 protein [Gymnodinialimonas ceratoperidinii]QXT39047.1 glycosyltransferase family 4 protein [Gymnodinialimonas ceratoperidinii]
MTAIDRNFNRPGLAIVDPCSAAGYDLPDLATSGLGGTEATILRVASALAPEFDVTIYQNGRERPCTSRAGRLLGLEGLKLKQTPDTIVVINRWKVALKLRKQFPETPIYLWLHVFPGRHNRKMGTALKAAGVEVICVSQTHAQSLRAFLAKVETPRVRFIYNPIDEGLAPDQTPRDPNKLLFASSPHKGLGQVFKQFSALRAELPDLTLDVADPGYLQWETGPVPEGVTFLGSLSHDALMGHMRRAFCLFYPQTQFAETFGLVLAEANALGTPVLVHRGLGANDEIVADADQRIDGGDPAQILQRIREWRHTPPHVRGNPTFRLQAVAQEWSQLLHRAAVAPKQ